MYMRNNSNSSDSDNGGLDPRTRMLYREAEQEQASQNKVSSSKIVTAPSAAKIPDEQNSEVKDLQEPNANLDQHQPNISQPNMQNNFSDPKMQAEFDKWRGQMFSLPLDDQEDDIQIREEASTTTAGMNSVPQEPEKEIGLQRKNIALNKGMHQDSGLFDDDFESDEGNNPVIHQTYNHEPDPSSNEVRDEPYNQPSSQTDNYDNQSSKETKFADMQFNEEYKVQLHNFTKKLKRQLEDFERTSSYALPSDIYVVEMTWFKKLKKFILYDQVNDFYNDELNYYQKITEQHIDDYHPGQIDNVGLLKSFDKYIRIDDEHDSSNFVMKGSIAGRDGYAFQKMPKSVWSMLSTKFGFDHEIRRGKDRDTYSYWQKYEFAHKSIKVHILPPYKQLTLEAIKNLKPIKVFLNADSTFRSVKEKIAAFIEKSSGQSCTQQQLRLWKPDFNYILVRNFAKYLQEENLLQSEEQTQANTTEPRLQMDRLLSGQVREEEMKENPQSVGGNVEQEEVEKNSGVEFPGLQFDMYLQKSYYNFQRTSQSFGITDILVVEQAEVLEDRQAKGNDTVKNLKHQFMFSYDKNETEPAKCENCYQFKKLRVRCPCGKADYCSQTCKEKDEEFHSNTCTFAQQLDINSVDFSKFQVNAAKGVLGLSNMGNTCYMNSALQCLSNSELLRNYFLSMRFREEINLANPLGTKGDVASRFAEVLYNLWAKQKPQTYYNSSYRPKHFKKAIGEANMMFKGFNQQDSMEFLNWLLDTLHEDLNRVKVKQYIEMPDLVGEDKHVSKTFWEVHLQRNQSIIVDLMAGQYKSTLTCPICSHKKINFDAFSSLQLPIPRQQSSKFYFVCTDPSVKIFQGELRFRQTQAEEPFINAKQRIAVQASEFHNRDIQPYDFIVAVVSKNNFRLMCIFDDTVTINASALIVNPSTEFIFCYEIDKRALKPGVNNDLPPNYVQEEIIEEEKTKQQDNEEEKFEHAYDKSEPYQHAADDYMESQINPHMDEQACNGYNADENRNFQKAGDYYGIQSNDSDGEVNTGNEKDTESQFATNTYPSYSKSKPYSNDLKPINQEPQRKFHDELKDRTVPIARALKDLTRDTWIKIPVQQTTREPGWAWGHSIESLPPRIMWFNLEWSLAEVHRQIVTKYLYMMKEYNADIPTYEDVYGLPLDDPQAELRNEHLDIEQTNLPFMVNIVNPFKDNFDNTFQCRNCKDKVWTCKNCVMPVKHDVKLFELLQNTCHKTKFGMNDFLFDHNQPQSQIGHFDVDSENEQNTTKSSGNWYDDNEQGQPIEEEKFINQKESNSDNIGRHKVFQFEIVFIKNNFQLYEQRSRPEEQKMHQDHPRMKAKIENQTIQNSETLENCLQKYKESEQLGENDTWYCSNCKDHVRAHKKLEIYKSGPVLALSFNRFKQNNIMYQEKLADPITFPIYGLDLSSHVLSHEQSQTAGANQDLVYDLFGVVNHFGSLNFGHYTAYGKNSETGQWHLYNDETVTSCDPHDVVSEAAYVLFYQLRSASPESSSQFEEVYQKFLQQPEFEDFSKNSKNKQGNKLANLALGKPQPSVSSIEESPLEKRISSQGEKQEEVKKIEPHNEHQKNLAKQESEPDTLNDEEIARQLAMQFENDAYQDWPQMNSQEPINDIAAAPQTLNSDMPAYNPENTYPATAEGQGQGMNSDVQMKSENSGGLSENDPYDQMSNNSNSSLRNRVLDNSSDAED